MKYLFFILFLNSTFLFAGSDGFEIKLWDQNVPGKNCVQGAEIVENPNPEIPNTHVRNIAIPTLTVYLPSGVENTTSGVVICPGGGYHILAIDKEGHDVARWFNDQGVAGFVLKYRLPCPQAGNSTPLPLLDAQRALRLIRSKAKEWHIDPSKIGIMGFSAGGHLASAAGTHFDEGRPDSADPVERFSSRPDFMILIYPVISLTKAYTHTGSRRNLLGDNPPADRVALYSSELQVTGETPPAFLIHTEADRVSARNSIDFFLALKTADVPAEMHIYAQGKHGYALRETGLPISTWPLRCKEWLGNLGMLK